jgi:hypothetical protein
MPSTSALTRANDLAIRRGLEQAGVEFIDAEKGGPGVAAAGTTTLKYAISSPPSHRACSSLVSRHHASCLGVLR